MKSASKRFLSQVFVFCLAVAGTAVVTSTVAQAATTYGTASITGCPGWKALTVPSGTSTSLKTGRW